MIEGTAPAQALSCPQCGGEVPAALAACPRCGAPTGADAAPSDWPPSPGGLAQFGFILLALLGALIVIGGVGYIVLALVFGATVLDSALAVAAVAIGAGIVPLCIRALDVKRWQDVSLPSSWSWLGGMVLLWGLGLGLQVVLPDRQTLLMPPLIVLTAWTMSQLFLSITLGGLNAPAGRAALSRRLAPQHRVLLASLLSASLSTALALLLEGIALVGTMAVILATLRFTEDQSALALITRAAEDPQTLARLEEAIIHSPTALIGLGFILVFVAPAIEELVKALPLLVFARHRPQIGERTAILIGVAGGIGFAFAENVGYLGMLSDEWALFFWFRAAAAVMHGAASGFVGRAWHRGLRGQWGRMLVDLCTGWGIHGGWNALALVVGWFSYREVTAGILFTIGFGLMPLALLFTVMAWWGIWVSRKA